MLHGDGLAVTLVAGVPETMRIQAGLPLLRGPGAWVGGMSPLVQSHAGDLSAALMTQAGTRLPSEGLGFLSSFQ